MPLESCMILLDNSEYMRNGDYIPTRLEAQSDAANLLVNAKTGSNPESTVGVIAMSSTGPSSGAELLVSPTDDLGKILAALHGVRLSGEMTPPGRDAVDIAASVQVAALALKHRRNKNGSQRIILFVGSPLACADGRALIKAGKQLKKNNVSIDVIVLGETEVNESKLRELVDAANGASAAASDGDNNDAAGGGGGGAANNPCSGGPALVPRVPVSLTDLFLDIVTVTSFSRVGAAIQDRGGIDLPILAYFAVFWMIWKKEESYSTRFDTTDISSHLTTLSVCFALLGGSLSAYSTFDSGGCTRIMGVAGFSALLHVVLHVRVFFWFKDVDDNAATTGGDAVAESVNSSVKRYAVFNSVVNTIETITWGIGMLLPSGSDWRKWIFLLGVVLNMRIPGMIMPNDFHAACSKRGVLFILLLGFNLQSILITASPFFNYWEPTWDQYAFLFLACFLLFMIKLLYVDDTYTIAPHDHALLYNSAAGFFFNMGNFALLLFTTVLGSGLNLLTHSYLAAAAALPNDAKNLVCGGLSAVVFSIFFIKCMHIRRVPTDPKHHEQMFLIAYSAQVVGILIVVGITARMCFLPAGATHGFFALLMRNEIEMLFVLVIFSVLLLVLSYSDEALELRLYSDASEASENRVRPFGIWTYFSHDEPLQLEAMALERNRVARLAQRSPLLGASVMSFSGSMSGFSMYNSFANFADV